MWSGDRLAFSVTAMKQQVSGIMDVFEDHVRLEVTLPWLLSRLAHGIQGVVQKKGHADAGEEVDDPIQNHRDLAARANVDRLHQTR